VGGARNVEMCSSLGKRRGPTPNLDFGKTLRAAATQGTVASFGVGGGKGPEKRYPFPPAKTIGGGQAGHIAWGGQESEVSVPAWNWNLRNLAAPPTTDFAPLLLHPRRKDTRLRQQFPGNARESSFRFD
jgi:hypothetical protein